MIGRKKLFSLPFFVFRFRFIVNHKTLYPSLSPSLLIQTFAFDPDTLHTGLLQKSHFNCGGLSL